MGILGTAISIDLESDHLIMRGLSHESIGCVLRGVLNIHLKQPTKAKSIELVFTGTVKTDWKEPRKHGHEQHYHTEDEVLEHKWVFLRPQYTQLHVLPAGHHTYEFELPVAGDLPESSKVASFYIAQYELKATIYRSYLLPNLIFHRPIQVIRLPSHLESPSIVSISNQWQNKLAYEISLPVQHYNHGEVIHATIRLIPFIRHLGITQMNCALMEMASCKPVDGRFGGRARTQDRIVHYSRTYGNNSMDPWHLAIPVPETIQEIQYDTKSPSVEIQHKLRFVLSIQSSSNKLIELQAVLPVIIKPKPVGNLPTYEQSYQEGDTFPYTPALMIELLRRNQQHLDSGTPTPSSLPTYDQVYCH